MKIPFEIGDLKWAAGSCPEKVTVKCPVCDGQKWITVILGSGEHLRVLCDACGLGFNGPRGVVEEYVYTPKAVRFEIASIRSMHNGRWSVDSTTGGYAEYEDLHDTEEAALMASRKNCHAQYERNMESRQQKRKSTQRAGWTVRYHRDQIKDLERQLEWHKSKIEAKPR